MLQMLKSVGKSVLSALLTEAFIKELVVYLLEKLAASTKNKLDDEIVQKVKEALKKA